MGEQVYQHTINTVRVFASECTDCARDDSAGTETDVQDMHDHLAIPDDDA